MPPKGTIRGYHRAKAMLPEIKELITQMALSDDTKREVLADEILLIIKKRWPKETPPARDTITRRISEARRKENQSPLDEPWHLGLLGKLRDKGVPDFSAEAVEAILNVQYWLSCEYSEASHKRARKKKLTGYQTVVPLCHTLSIRQAKWIAALYRWTEEDTGYLWEVSFHYAYREIVSEIARTQFDTISLDNALYNGKIIFRDHVQRHYNSAKYEPGDEIEKALSIMSTATRRVNEREREVHNKTLKAIRDSGGIVRIIEDKNGKPINKIVKIDLPPEDDQEGER